MSAAAGVDFFRSGALPAPPVNPEEAERIGAVHGSGLYLDTDGADFFADALDRVLTEGW
jgi:hypothetical protein